jgi:hypothetical protein
MLHYLLASLLILLLLLGWIGTQMLARRFAHRHPEFGPAREEGSGCGGCGCQNGSCRKE